MLPQLPTELQEFISISGLEDEIRELLLKSDKDQSREEILNLIKSKLHQPATATGSLRAPEGYHLPMAMKESGDNVFLKFGGHPGAAGFTALESNLPTIQKGLSQALLTQKNGLKLSQSDFIPDDYQFTIPTVIQPWSSLKNLIWISPDALTSEFLEQILALGPFGQDFPFPGLVFPISSDYIQVCGNFKVIGTDQNHIKLTLPGDLNLTCFFVDTEIINTLQSDIQYQLWVIAEVSQNTWNQSTKIELIGNKVQLVASSPKNFLPIEPSK